MRELGSVVDVGADEAALLVWCGVQCRVARERCGFVVVIVTPLGEMVGELQTTCVGSRVLEVYNN